MPSFDIVSEIDMHELTNAVSNANRAITQRYDFKGTQTTIKQSKEEVTLISESEFQVQQVRVTGKKRDDLQAVMALLKDQELAVALQFTQHLVRPRP